MRILFWVLTALLITSFAAHLAADWVAGDMVYFWKHVAVVTFILSFTCVASYWAELRGLYWGVVFMFANRRKQHGP